IQAHDLVWLLAASLLPFFDLRGHWPDWREVQEAALRSVRAGRELQAKAWIELGFGYLRWVERSHEQALSHLEEALEMATACRRSSGSSARWAGSWTTWDT